jgi:phage terminase small subunit
MALTPKQEAFAQAVVVGMSISDAYRAAYKAGKMSSAAVNVEASRLMANPTVALRVQELRKPVVEAAQYGLAEAMAEAAEAMELSRETRQSGAFVAAVSLRAKLSGLMIDKKEIRTGELDGLGHDELKQLRDALTSIGLSGQAQGAAAEGQGRPIH